MLHFEHYNFLRKDLEFFGQCAKLYSNISTRVVHTFVSILDYSSTEKFKKFLYENKKEYIPIIKYAFIKNNCFYNVYRR